MDIGWISVLMPVVVALISAAYTIGGRAALLRRSIRQDLELSEQLEPGAAKTAVAQMAEEKAVLYVGRWVGPQRLGWATHLRFAVLTCVTGLAAIGTAKLVEQPSRTFLPDPIPTVLAYVSVLAIVATLSFGTAWLVFVVTADNAVTRSTSVDAARARLARYLNPAQPPTPPSPPA